MAFERITEDFIAKSLRRLRAIIQRRSPFNLPSMRAPREKAKRTLWVLFDLRKAAQKGRAAARRRLRRRKHGWR